MAAQDEREPGDIAMGEGLLDPMAQDEEVEQEMLVVEEEQFFPPQMDPEPGMGAAAAEAAVYDTSPSPLYQNPPTLAESAQPVTIDMTQLVAILAGIKNEINEKANRMEEKMDGNTQKNGEHEPKDGWKHRQDGKNAGGDAEHGCVPAG